MMDENNVFIKAKINAITSKFTSKIKRYVDKYFEIIYNTLEIRSDNFYWHCTSIIIQYFHLIVLILDETFFPIWNRLSFSRVVFNYIKYVNISLFLNDRKILFLIILNVYILIVIATFILILFAIITNKINISSNSIFIIFLSKFLPSFAFTFFGITFFLLISIFLCDQETQMAFFDIDTQCRSNSIFKIELPFTIISIIIQIIISFNCIIIYYTPNFIVEKNDLFKKSNSYSDIIFLVNKLIIIILYLLNQGNSNSRWGIIIILFIITGINACSVFFYKSYENKNLLLLHKFLSIVLFWGICSLIISKIFKNWNFDGGLYLFFFGIIILIIYFFYKTNNQEILQFYCIDFNYIKSSKERLLYIKQYLNLLQNKCNDRSSNIIFQSLIGNKEDNCVNPNCKLKQYLELYSQGYESHFMLLQYCQQLFESSISKFPKDVTLKCNFIIFLIVYLNKKKLAQKIFSSLILKQFNFQDNYIVFYCKKYIEKYSKASKNNVIQINQNILNASEYKYLFQNFLIQIIKVSSLYLEFWSSLLNYYLEGTENFGKLSELASDIISINNEVNIIFEKLHRVKSDDLKVINIYSSFIKDILNDEQKYNNIKNMIAHSSNNIKIDDRKIDYCNFDLKILSDNDEYRYLSISTHEKNRGNIVDISLNSCLLFGYTRHEIIGKNINLLIPEIYHRKHDKLMSECCENFKNKFYENLYMKIDYKPSILNFFTHGRNKSKYLIPLYLKIFLVQTEDSDILILVEFVRKEEDIIDNSKFLKSNEINLITKNLDGCICILTDSKFIIQSFTPNSIEFLGINSNLINSNYNITQYIKEFQEEIHSYAMQPNINYNIEASEAISKSEFSDVYGSSGTKKNDNEQLIEIPLEKQIIFFRRLIKNKYNKPQMITWRFFDIKLIKESIKNILDRNKEINLSKKNKNKVNSKFYLQILPSEISGKVIGYKFYFQKLNDSTKIIQTKKNNFSNTIYNKNFLSPNYNQGSTRKIRFDMESISLNPEEPQKINKANINKSSSLKILQTQEDFEIDKKNNESVKNFQANRRKSKEKFRITENIIPNSECNFVLDIKVNSYKLEKNIKFPENFNEILKEKSIEKMKSYKSKNKKIPINDKEYISFSSSSHSSALESSSSSNSGIKYSSSSSSSNNNMDTNDSKIKNTKPKIRYSNHMVKSVAQSPFIKNKIDQYNGLDYYKVNNLNKIRLMVFDFDKEMIVDNNKFEKRSEMENIIYNYKSRISSNLDKDISYPSFNINFTHNKKKSDERIDEKIYSDKNNNKINEIDLIKDINSSINKNEKEYVVKIFTFFSCICTLILLILSLLFMIYIVKRRKLIKTNVQLIIYATKIRYYLANSVYYVREITLLNLNYYTKTIGNYTRPPSNNKTQYLINIGQTLLETYHNLHDNLGLIEQKDFSFTKETYFYLFEEPHTIKISNNVENSKNINMSLISSYVQATMALSCLCVNTTKIKQNSEDLLNFMSNTLNEVGKNSKNLINILLIELKYHVSFDIKIIVVWVPIFILVHIAIYFILIKFYKLSLNKKTSYLAVFYGIEYNLIQNSMKNCEKYLNKIKRNECMYINNIKNDSLFDDDSSSYSHFEEKKINKSQKTRNSKVQKNNKNENKDKKQSYKIKLFKIQFIISLILSCIYLSIINFLFYQFITKTKKLANYNFHMERLHNGILNLFNYYREFLFDNNTIINGTDSYNTLINIEQELYDGNTDDISCLNLNHTLISGLSKKYNELLNRNLCSFKTNDYLNNVSECVILMDDVIAFGFYNLASFLIEEIRVQRNKAKSYMDNNLYVGNLTRFGIDNWTNESLGLNENNNTFFRVELFNNYKIHAKMNILFINIILPFIEEQKKLITESILKDLVVNSATNVILFLVYYIIIVSTLFFYWLPMTSEINNTISKTKNMLSIIPTRILSEQANIKTILNISENN